jgi:hypothetical protein
MSIGSEVNEFIKCMEGYITPKVLEEYNRVMKKKKKVPSFYRVYLLASASYIINLANGHIVPISRLAYCLNANKKRTYSIIYKFAREFRGYKLDSNKAFITYLTSLLEEFVPEEKRERIRDDTIKLSSIIKKKCYLRTECAVSFILACNVNGVRVNPQKVAERLNVSIFAIRNCLRATFFSV